MKPADKSAVNPFFKSKYADLGSVWESCRKALSDNGLAVLQGVRSTVDSVEVETTLVHASGQWFSESLALPSKRDAQSIGSAATYARRYGLSALVGVVADEDDDGNAAVTPMTVPQPSKKTPPPPRPTKIPDVMADEPPPPPSKKKTDNTYANAKDAIAKATTEGELTHLGGLLDERRAEGKLTADEHTELVNLAVSSIENLKAKLPI
jgi:hypothetical protein